IILWTKTISRHGWKRAAREITVRNAAQKLQVHRYFDNPVASPFTDTLEIFRSAGIRRVLHNHLLSGLGEMKNSLCKSGYLRRV
ncbi:hypothetical protein MJN85_31690, partial [Salmonella enterica subsp. enterica serovar Anatum]|nr:hypothetical protein [Salmonella enterica subsp. enterica serovar Anatum]